MATAVETSSQARTPSSSGGLVASSLLGAVYVLAALAVVFYLVPTLWQENVSPRLNRLTDAPLLVVVQLAVAGVLWGVGQMIAGANPPRGIRGGIFLIISAVIAIFFLVRAVGLMFDGPVGMGLTGLVAAGLVYLAIRFLTGPTGERRMIALEEQGWFHTHSYKKALGQKVRRLTMLGLLLIGGSGVYSLYFQGTLPDNWRLALPFTDQVVTVITNAKYAIPLLLLGGTLWFAWRAVNMPTFAEFLIATEAEMNKVSWTPKKRLVQDTVVVLVTTFLLTMFLLVVDLFWSWLLSRQMIGVLPSRSTTQEKAARVQEAGW